MSGSFDPYREWLGIAPHERPLHYYRLLGVDLYERDSGRIARAADERITEVRKWQQGLHSAASQQILTELAQARVCLLDTGKRRLYDEKLQAFFSGRSTATTPAAAAVPPAAPPQVPFHQSSPSFSAAPPPAPYVPEPVPTYYASPPVAPAGEGELPGWVLPVFLAGGLGVLTLFAVGIFVQGLFSGGEQPAVAIEAGTDPPAPVPPPMPPVGVEPMPVAPPPPPAPDPNTLTEAFDRWGKPDKVAPVEANPWGKAGLPGGSPAELPVAPPASTPTPTPAPVAAVPAPPTESIVTGQDDEWAGTTGLFGEVNFDGQPMQVLLHYRLGVALEANSVRQQCLALGAKIPAPDSEFNALLTGRLEVKKKTTVRFVKHATFAQSELVLYLGTNSSRSVFASSPEGQVKVAEIDLDPGTYRLAWNVAGTIQQEGTLHINGYDRPSVVVGYLASEIETQAVRREVGEILIAQHKLRARPKRATAPAPAPVPALPASPAGVDLTMPGTRVFRPGRPAPMPPPNDVDAAKRAVYPRYQARLDAAEATGDDTKLVPLLIDAAERTPDLPTRRAVFDIALDAAVFTGRYDYIDSVYSLLTRHFQIDDVLQQKLAHYEMLAVADDNFSEHKRLSQRCGELALQCLSQGNLELAQSWVDLALDHAHDSSDDMTRRAAAAIEQRVQAAIDDRDNLPVQPPRGRSGKKKS